MIVLGQAVHAQDIVTSTGSLWCFMVRGELFSILMGGLHQMCTARSPSPTVAYQQPRRLVEGGRIKIIFTRNRQESFMFSVTLST